jgi:hypothetical protein
MTEQELFDLACAHLYSMPGRAASTASDACYYRTADGNRCAVGYFITDEEYDTDMELKSLRDLVNAELLPPRLVPFERILEALQKVHDDEDNWEPKFIGGARLAALATRFNLSASKLFDLIELQENQ